MPVKSAAPRASLHLALIGAGIRHSPSPAMQQAALDARGLRGEYSLLDVAPEELPGLLNRIRAGELTGCNVTVPYKSALAAACDRLEGDAAVCQAVNTLVGDAGELVGDDTDARGFELALGYLRLLPESGGTGLVFGAGGGAAAVVLALCRMGVEEIAVAARRVDQASDLCLRVSPENGRPVAWEECAELEAIAENADIVVNATSTGAGNLPLPLDVLPERCIVADLRYRPRPVDLVEAAEQRGLRATDGVEMLLFQGMLSFQRWTGADPPWHAARQALVAALEG
ncbi:MAG TPA: shikimate dehydrogenase [Candidatus Binatia bacterium]|nr:shikimate dehydrogenase [Candidatus Binatia bacterium]